MRILLPILIIAVIGFTRNAQAQQASCGLTTMTEMVQPLYPPIARAARVEGVVVLLVDFDLNGTVQSVRAISGPEMLRLSATTSVKTWHANTYSGPRTCPVAVTFHLNWTKTMLASTIRSDPQHIIVNSTVIALDSTPNYEVMAATR